MTNDELREKIAQAKGFSRIRHYNNDRMTGLHFTEEWGDTRDNIPDYPNDIAAAWKLVEEIQSEPHEQVFELYRMPVISPRWYAYIGVYRKDADTAPRAICEAYLAWKAAQE